MKEIGLRESMTDMELKHGLGAVGTGDNIDKGLDMVLEYTGFIQEMFTLGSGLTGRVMVVVFIPVMMAAGM